MSILDPLVKAWRSVFGVELPVGDWDTKGPPEDEHPITKARDILQANIGAAGASTPDIAPPHPQWLMGVWARALFKPAHPGRIGPTIKPQCVVVHTTDMHPDTHDALVKNWLETPGQGNAAHFLIGRTEAQGTVQFCSITRNGNHAGGPTHGWYRTAKGSLIHPNTIAVGIELDCAGRLYKDGLGRWRCGEYVNGKLAFNGSPIASTDVYVDKQGHGWHLLTEYQKTTLGALLRDLRACMPQWPNYEIAPNGTYLGNGVPWAQVGAPYTEVVGHVTLDPNNKTDPGPQTMAWITEIY